MSNKLKKMNLSSVDFVGAGANQDADIMLKKNRSDQEALTEKTLWEKFKSFMKGEYTDAEIDAYSINKAKQNVKDENQLYTEVLKESIDSIVQNDSLTPREKTVMMRKSLSEFNEAFDDAIENWSELAKSVNEDNSFEQKGREMVIDTERLTQEERDIYKALTRKAQVSDENIDDEEILDEIPEEEADVEKEDDIEVDKCGQKFKKEDDLEIEKEDPEEEPLDDEELDKCSPKVKKSILGEMEALKKNVAMLQKQRDMEEMTAVAKKYEVLGNDTQEVAETLYELKKTAPKQYERYLNLLNENLNVVTKSGLFGEIGKSGHIGARVESTVTGKIEAKTSEIMKSNPGMSVYEAREQAWRTSPELAMEYEADYRERR